MKILGSQFGYTLDVITAYFFRLDAGGRKRTPEENAALAKDLTRVVMQVLVSVAVLLTGIYLLVRGDSDKQRELGSALIGTVLGYWLR